MRVVEFVLIAMTFALLGPFVGTIAVATGIGLVALAHSSDALALLLILPVIILGFGVGYLVGTIPAVIAGAVVGIKQVWFGGAGWLFALGAGALAGIAVEIYWHEILNHGAAIDLPVGLLFIVALFSTIACWSMIKTFVRKANP
jgi:hypothetical protein